MTSQSSASLFQQESSVHVQESYAISPAHPMASPLTVFYSYPPTISSIPYPEFWASDTLPRYFGAPLYQSQKFIKNMLKQLCTHKWQEYK